MARILPLLLVLSLALPGAVTGDTNVSRVEDALRRLGIVGSPGPDDETVVSGLREALSLGTEKAVSSAGRKDGYLGNPRIAIPMPEKLVKAEKLLRKVGQGKQADEFIASMNRAAEKAAPQAASIFLEAVRKITFEDARRILRGGDTAATDYFQGKTSGRLAEVFRPQIASAMEGVGATRSCKRMMERYRKLPLAEDLTIDLDQYVTQKALDGLFTLLAEEEKRIRTDPAARVTELLKTVFESTR